MMKLAQKILYFLSKLQQKPPGWSLWTLKVSELGLKLQLTGSADGWAEPVWHHGRPTAGKHEMNTLPKHACLTVT